MFGLQAKLILAAVVVAIIGGVIWYEIGIHKKAARADAAEARAEAAEKGRAEDMAKVMQRLDKDAEDRRQFAARFDAIEKRFDDIKIPPPAKLVQNREVPSVEGKCVAPSVGVEFVSVWNLASEP